MATKSRPSFDPKSFLAVVGEGRGIGEYRKDQIVFSQGDPADAVFYIQSGKVKVTVVSEQGKEAVVAMLGTNDFFGEGCLAGQMRRIATVLTMMDSVIVRLEKAAIVRVIHREPAFSGMFIAHLLARAIRVEADLVDQLFTGLRCAAAPNLLRSARRSSRSGCSSSSMATLDSSRRMALMRGRWPTAPDGAKAAVRTANGGYRRRSGSRKSAWDLTRRQGEGEYDCGFHSIFFKGMVAYLPLVFPVSDEVILPFLPTPRRFLRLRISDSAWTFRSKFPSAHRTSQRGAPEEFFVR
jgi:CRP-like cAMP-binding protein